VLDHVRRLAVDGVVPCEALTTGPEEQSRGWWKAFAKEVTADARRRGLSRPRWGRSALTTLSIVAVVPAALAAAALIAAPDDSESEEDSPIVGFFALTAVAWGGLMAIPALLRAERDTPAGLVAAGRWLGLRDYLGQNEAFDRAPPAAVAIWDRYLAYGAAMGVAAGAVRGLPLGSESDTAAWSAYGGRWRVVKVRYPARFPPGWGQRPLVAAAKGGGMLLAAGLFARALGPPLVDAVADVGSIGDGWEPWFVIPLVIFSIMLLALVTVLLRSAAMLVLGLSDLTARVEVEGLVIRLRNGYVAVDDGVSQTVRAWRVEPLKLGGVARGSLVGATVSPRLGYVHDIRTIGERPGEAGLAAVPVDGAPEAAAGPAPSAPRGLPPGLDLDDLAARTGVRLRPSPGEGAPTFPGSDQVWVLSDGGSGQVMVMVSSDHDGAGGAPALAAGVVRWVARRGGRAVDGVGEEATWSRGNVLTARRDRRHVTVMVGLPDLSEDARLEVGKALAEAVL
jgi:hypothetical protein